MSLTESDYFRTAGTMWMGANSIRQDLRKPNVEWDKELVRFALEHLASELEDAATAFTLGIDAPGDHKLAMFALKRSIEGKWSSRQGPFRVKTLRNLRRRLRRLPEL